MLLQSKLPNILRLMQWKKHDPSPGTLMTAYSVEAEAALSITISLLFPPDVAGFRTKTSRKVFLTIADSNDSGVRTGGAWNTTGGNESSTSTYILVAIICHNNRLGIVESITDENWNEVEKRWARKKLIYNVKESETHISNAVNWC